MRRDWRHRRLGALAQEMRESNDGEKEALKSELKSKEEEVVVLQQQLASMRLTMGTTRTCTHARTHTHTYTHTRANTCKHTYICQGNANYQTAARRI